MPEFKGSKEEAMFLMRLVKAYQAAQAVLDHTSFILKDFGLLREGTDNLNSDKIIELGKKL